MQLSPVCDGRRDLLCLRCKGRILHVHPTPPSVVEPLASSHPQALKHKFLLAPTCPWPRSCHKLFKPIAAIRALPPLLPPKRRLPHCRFVDVATRGKRTARSPVATSSMVAAGLTMRAPPERRRAVSPHSAPGLRTP